MVFHSKGLMGSELNCLYYEECAYTAELPEMIECSLIVSEVHKNY